MASPQQLAILLFDHSGTFSGFIITLFNISGNYNLFVDLCGNYAKVLPFSDTKNCVVKIYALPDTVGDANGFPLKIINRPVSQRLFSCCVTM